MSERAPALGRPSFACPHCSAFAAQAWFKCRAVGVDSNDGIEIPPADAFNSPADFPKTLTPQQFAEVAPRMRKWRDKMRSGEPFIEGKGDPYSAEVPNVFFSRCFACSRVAAWMGDALVVPKITSAPAPHPDTPQSVLHDFNEARLIVGASPRGAAALLRLCVQKICVELGLPGKDLNKDIGALVDKGLPVQIQQALDAVRVVGNESVHPGEMDLKDDQATAEHLFDLVNMVVEDRISKPKALDALYARLPQGKRDGIAQRDAGKA